MNFGASFLFICLFNSLLRFETDAMPDFYNGEASGKESFSDSTDNNPLEEYSQEVQGIVEDLPAEENIFSSENQVEVKGQELSKECLSSKINSCQVSLPGVSNAMCNMVRKTELAKKKMFYKLRKLNSNPGPGEFQIPVLDQPAEKILELSLTDPFTAHHFNMLFIAFGKTLKDKILPVVLKQFSEKDLTSYQGYFQITDFFKKALKLDKSESKYFRVPSAAYPYYTDIEKDKKFLEDKYFVQLRLAGINPMSIQRVALEGEIGVKWTTLASKLNPSFKWEEAVQQITGKDLDSSIRENMVYVLEFPLLEGLKDMPDILDGKTKPPGVKMLPHVNPIAIFATKLGKKSQKYRMKVVAIQVDSKKDAEVFTPKDGFDWEIAKARVQGADFLFSQIHEHLLRTHFRMETVCVSLYRHLSDFHPIHQILKYHCRGLFPLNANGTIVLLSPGKYAHALFSVGNLGTYKLLQDGYKNMVWNDFGIDNVRRRGMDDEEKVPYFPYRDDGRVIHKSFKKFAKKLVSLYYKSNDAVVQDPEIQNFINELSVDGTRPPFNGQGHIKGLPGRFDTKKQVANFIVETLWIQVQHAVISYTPGILGTQAPLYPTKLYDDPRAKEKKEFVYMLPGAFAACMQAGLSHTVGALQYDVMFDYSDDIQDPVLKRLVAETYDYLMCNIKVKLDARNKARASYNRLTNPFMVPGWMPNSIST